MHFNLDILTIVILVLTIFNAKLASGRKKRIHSRPESNSEEIDVWIPEDTQNEAPKQIDIHGSVRGSLAMHMVLMEPNKNAVCSPVSALLPLGKIVLGARGRTQKELLKAIGYNRKELKPQLKKVIEDLKQLPGVTLNVVSKIYISREVHLNPGFTKESKDIFNSAVEKVSFEDLQETVQSINSWVKRHTNGMIPNLISPSDISSEPSIVLVNAVYFQGNWKKHFNQAVPSTFYAPMGTRRVPMMSLTDRLYYVNDETLNAQILELPYVSENASFIVVLPNDRNGLPMLLTALKLAPKLLNKAMKKMSQKIVTVRLPKFKVTSKINLKDLYKKIGVNRIFSPDLQELNDIVMGQSVYVSSAIQQAVIEVSETGTEAAAGTATIFTTSSLNSNKDKVIFTADHPFLFMVLAKAHQLFVGSYNAQ